MSKTPIPLRVKIDSLLWRAYRDWRPHDPVLSYPQHGILCGICDRPLAPGEKIDWDHHLRENAGGTTDYMNIRPLHRECHKRKTFHPRSKATTLGSDVGEAAKTKRLAKGPRQRKGREIQGAGFRPAPPGYKHRFGRPAQKETTDG